MKTPDNYNGYQENFLDEDLKVPMPGLSQSLLDQVAPVEEAADNILRYPNYSVIQSATRKLPILTAANVNGELFKKITRKKVGGRWKKDKRIDENHQFGLELYRAAKSNFDRGHMTKREDVQWAETDEPARQAAKATFFYTNAAPQHKKVNRAIWRDIEDFILHDESIQHDLKINLFTGPVLKDDDPVFITKIDGQEIRIPDLFWKVIYFTRSNQQLSRVSFLVGQKSILESKGIVKPVSKERGIFIEEELFMDFEFADTYQVNTSLVESLTGLTFPDAIEPFWDLRPSKLILEEVGVRGLLGGTTTVKGLFL